MFLSRLSQIANSHEILKHTFHTCSEHPVPLCYYSLGRFNPFQPLPEIPSRRKKRAPSSRTSFPSGREVARCHLFLCDRRAANRGVNSPTRDPPSPPSPPDPPPPPWQRNACPTESFIPRNCKSNPRPFPIYIKIIKRLVPTNPQPWLLPFS